MRLTPFALQVAGHRAEDGGPSTFTDESGLVLLKRVPRTDVGDREQAFYSCAELVRPPSTQRAPAPPPGTEACTWRPEAVACLLRVDASLARAASRQLAELTDVVPECHGTLYVGEERLLCLRNLVAGFARPNIVDIKIGFETTYPWADEAYNAKNRKKDVASSQAARGFKISGMHVWTDRGAVEGAAAITLTKTDCASADAEALLGRFGAAHEPSARAGVWQHVLSTLQRLNTWYARDRTADHVAWHFRSVSMLVVSEAEGTAAPQAGGAGAPQAVSCHLIDFGHCFATAPAPDSPFLEGLASLARAVRAVAERGGRGLTAAVSNGAQQA